jgi:hypothetical protein
MILLLRVKICEASNASVSELLESMSTLRCDNGEDISIGDIMTCISQVAEVVRGRGRAYEEDFHRSGAAEPKASSVKPKRLVALLPICPVAFRPEASREPAQSPLVAHCGIGFTTSISQITSMISQSTIPACFSRRLEFG